MRSQQHVLVVEDEHALSRALTFKLRKEHLKVTPALDGEEALNLLKKNRFDLVIVDLVIPKHDGFEVLKAIQKQDISTPIIVLSNLSQPNEERQVKEMGIQNFFVKSNVPIMDIIIRSKSLLKN
jgi:DNA-binding response OmpR family regulator